MPRRVRRATLVAAAVVGLTAVTQAFGQGRPQLVPESVTPAAIVTEAIDTGKQWRYMIVPFGHVLLLAGILFMLGMFCAVARRNLIMILLGVEIMLNAATIVFIGASLRWQQMEGQVFVLFIFAVAAAEVSVGLALIISAYRRTTSVDPNNYNLLK